MTFRTERAGAQKTTLTQFSRWLNSIHSSSIAPPGYLHKPDFSFCGYAWATPVDLLLRASLV